MSPKTPTAAKATADEDASTGIEGLDDILGGGFMRNRLYLVEGVPGSGKTTLAMQFLMAGVRRGERVLYVTLSETADELRSSAASHGWSMDGLVIHEFGSAREGFDTEAVYTMFHPSEVELMETTKSIIAEVEKHKPTRVVFDSLSEMRMLAGSPMRSRRQVMALKHYFARQKCTLLVLDDMSELDRDLQVHSIAHGVILLDQIHSEYGSERRRMRVVKYRGRSFRGGFHDFVIRYGGLCVFPRLVAGEHRRERGEGRLASGIAQLDRLLGTGIERGTSTLILGAPGTGKSSIATQFAYSAAERGEKAAMFIFDEIRDIMLMRAAAFGMDLDSHIESGRIAVTQVDPAELSPGELTYLIRQAVEKQGATVVVIDSLNGYLNAMPEERFLTIQLHELLTFLNQLGVVTILVGAHQGLIGSSVEAPVDASYLADTVLLLRYFEAAGEVRQALSVMKKRSGAHERSIRELKLKVGGIVVGEPLDQFHGVLSGFVTIANSTSGAAEVVKD